MTRDDAPAQPGRAGGAGLLPGVRPGSRVVVRYLIEDGARATDVIGILISLDDETLEVESPRHGTVRVPLRDIVVAKPVPAAPAPRRRRNSGDPD